MCQRRGAVDHIAEGADNKQRCDARGGEEKRVSEARRRGPGSGQRERHKRSSSDCLFSPATAQ